MIHMIQSAFLIIMLTGIFIFLYDRGYMAIKSISAVSFVGFSKENGARFTSCNGYLKRIVRFKSDGTSRFSLDAELTKGDVSVELLSITKERLMVLNCASPNASVTVEKGKKYYLIVRFKSMCRMPAA